LLAGLTKRRVRALAAHLGAPEHLISKVPTADLEDGRPLSPDEESLGVSYDAIDDYLEGKEVSEQDRRTIEGWHARTAHKRAMPVTPDDSCPTGRHGRRHRNGGTCRLDLGRLMWSARCRSG